jgi:acetyl/propionyl-CoA carboxylase alpha subunit/acetyl-CoA carboxylase carboxyltransferase component
MKTAVGLGRVAVVDGGEGAPRVLRALRELMRAGHARAIVAFRGGGSRSLRSVREADEVFELRGPVEEALRTARADSAWLGAAPLPERAQFAEACERAGIAHLGPPAEALRRAAGARGVAELASRIGARATSFRDIGPHERVIEAIVARDQGGTARLLGLGDASLRCGDVAVLTESPPPGLTPDEERTARDLAERACAAADWVGVCAVQQAFDPGTRQLALLGIDPFALSAPALEATMGVDLVELALLIAAGFPLRAFATPAGHAFAARVQARDPEAVAVTPGRVEVLSMPSGPGLRVDVAVPQGNEPSGPEAVLCTVVTRGATREEAMRRLQQALADGDVLLRGSGTSKAWLRALCGRREVTAGEVSVGLIDQLSAAGSRLVARSRDEALLVAAIDAYHAEEDLERMRFVAEARRGRPRVGPSSGRTVELRDLDHRFRLRVQQLGPSQYRVTPSGGSATDFELNAVGELERQLVWRGKRHRVFSIVDGLHILAQVDDVAHLIQRDPAGIVASPMPAVVAAIHVQRGQHVTAGDPLVRIESMKVEVEVVAPHAGVVREVLAPVNGQVHAGAPLLRLEPAGESPGSPLRHGPDPLSFGQEPVTEPGGPRDRYLGALTRLRQLLLGFDVTAAEARNLADEWRSLASAVEPGDADVVRREDWALEAFADIQSLFSRARGGENGNAPRLEELWRYLHEPEARGAGLSAPFVTLLRRALSHYAVSMEAPGRSLELALLRIQKARERADDQLALVIAILERRLQGTRSGTSREVLDGLAEAGQERFPALADLAREVRYRSFDQPALQQRRAQASAQAQQDLAHLPTAAPAERDAIVARLVESAQPLTNLLLSTISTSQAPGVKARLTEALMRRYYRFRSLETATSADADGLPCAWVEYTLHGQNYRLVVCSAAAAEGAHAARRLSRLASDVPADREVIVEIYLWQEGASAPPDEVAASLGAALHEARFGRTIRRASIVLAVAGGGGGSENQQHFTFRREASEWTEERRYRGVHPMLFERLQLGRLAKFDLERLPSVEDVYLYRAVAERNRKDERLFAMAEVRDLTPVRDAEGRVIQLPELERILHEALAGMRMFQARRDPAQRLEWNRVLLTLTPPLDLSREDLRRLGTRLAPATEGLGLEMVLLTARVPDPGTGQLRETLLRVITAGQGISIRWEQPTDRPLEPMEEYQQRVVQLRRRGLTHPFELVRMLAPPQGAQAVAPPGDFVEYDLDASNALVPVQRPPGTNTANMVAGVIRNFTPRYPEGMTRVILLGDPGREMGSVAEPECRRIVAAIDLAEKLRAPLEWFEVCAGAKISMTSGTENMDWVSRVLRRLIEFTQRGGEVNVVVMGITVGAQPYWNAEATMLMHTRGILVMTPGSTMVLTGKQALEYSGSVSAEDNEGIGGYDRIMGPNGQAQYFARSVTEAVQILMHHYEHAYVAPGERFPRRAPTSDPRDRDVRLSPHGTEGGADFRTVGEIFSHELNPDRKKPFEIRKVMAAAIDQDHAPLERWRDMRGGDTAVVWDADLGGWPVCLIGIQSRPLPRLEFVPADGPEFWSAGTLFPQSSKKIARAVNSASGNRPLVILANLSGFDGSPESMRKLQLEYGAEIGRSVVNFDGPIVFCVVSRYHGGAFVVFAKTLTENIEIAAVEGARASVIGGAPAAAVVFAREVEARTRKDPRVIEAGKNASPGNARALAEVAEVVRSEKLGEVGVEYDRVHSVERALKMGSLDRIIAAGDLRPYLIDAVERGIAKFSASS